MLRRSMTHRGVLARLMAATVLLMALVGCGSSGPNSDAAVLEGSWDDVVAAAKEEGRVVFLNGVDQSQAQRVAAAFHTKYPEIEVEVEQGIKDTFARISAQVQSGTDGADVFMTSDESFFKDNPDWWLPMRGPGTEGVKDGIWVVDAAVPNVSASPFSTFTWNTTRFPNGFRDFQEFLTPEVKGQLAFRGDATRSAVGYMDFLTERFGEDYLRDIGAQDPKLYPSITPMTQAVASGEAGVTMASYPSMAQSLQASGAPIDYFVPPNGFGVNHQAAALASAHRPNAAMVFTDFLLSPEGQAALVAGGVGSSVREDTPDALDLSGYTMLDGAKYSSEDLQDWQAKIDQYFHGA